MWGYFLFSLVMFLINVIVLVVLGWGILQALFKNHGFPVFSLSHLVIAYGAGLISTIIYSMLIIVYYSFSFISVTLPILCVDALILFLNRRRIMNQTKAFFNTDLKINLRSLCLKYTGLLVILIFQINFMLRFFMANYSIATWDSYAWYQLIIVFHKEGVYLFEPQSDYPPGFIITCGFFTSMLSDYYQVYFFLKFLPVFCFCINIIVVYLIAERIFKERYAVFFFLAFSICIPYTYYRYTQLLPSIFADTFGLLFGLLLIQPENVIKTALNPADEVVSHALFNKNHFKHVIFTENNLTLGIMLFGFGLYHFLYYLFFLICYIAFEFLSFIWLVLSGYQKNIRTLRSIVISFPLVIIVQALLLIPIWIFINHFGSFSYLINRITLLVWL